MRFVHNAELPNMSRLLILAIIVVLITSGCSEPQYEPKRRALIGNIQLVKSVNGEISAATEHSSNQSSSSKYSFEILIKDVRSIAFRSGDVLVRDKNGKVFVLVGTETWDDNLTEIVVDESDEIQWTAASEWLGQ